MALIPRRPRGDSFDDLPPHNAARCRWCGTVWRILRAVKFCPRCDRTDQMTKPAERKTP